MPKSKEELKRELEAKLRERVRAKREAAQPTEKTTKGFLSSLKEEFSLFSKGVLSIGKKVLSQPIAETTGEVLDLAFEVDRQLPKAASAFAKEAKGLLTHPIDKSKEALENLKRLRAIPYNEQKKLIDESLQSISSSQTLNKNQKVLAQFGTAIAGDLVHEVTHPVEFMYDRPFTFGLDLLSVGQGKLVGKGVNLTKQMMKDTKVSNALSDIFIPNSKLKRAGYNSFADDLSKTSSSIYNMQEGIIKSTAKKFEKDLNLSGTERLDFFETIDALRREDQVLYVLGRSDLPPIRGDIAKTKKGMIKLSTKEMKAKNLNPRGTFYKDKFGNILEAGREVAEKATSRNPKVQKAIDWWLDSELPKLQKAVGLPEEKRITNYLHHLFPERVAKTEKAARPFRSKRGFLKKSKDVAGFSKDPVVSISAIKIKTAMANMKDAFLRRTETKYGKEIKELETRLFGEVGPEKFDLLEKTGKITDEIKKRYNVESFVKKANEVAWLPKEIADELNKVFAANPTSDILNMLFAPLDFFNRNWKPLATAVRPRYHTRNIVGNLYNSIVIGGMNPTNIPKAARQQLAGYMNEARKTDGVAGKLAKKFFPDRINDKVLRMALKDEVVGRGFFSIDLHDLAKAGNFTEDIMKTINRIKDPAEIYKIPVLKQYLNLSKSIGSAIEDNARLSLYMNQLKKGASRKAAKEYVNKHLFDYLQGLGEGDKIIKRFIPFWSWQRFNIPLQTESVFTKSRRLAAIQHGVEGEVRSKELEDESRKYLSEKERESGLYKMGEEEINGRTMSKYMRTQVCSTSSRLS